MEYRIGNAKKIKELGTTELLTCPACNQKAEMPVYANGKTELIAELPLIKSGKVYFTVCPHCAAAYAIETRAGKTFAKGEPLAIGNFDLKPLEAFHIE